jgi:midasin
VFAAITSGSSLLLEGPPGIGKTAVVNQVARLLGHRCERINFSASTTSEQLFGSIIPRWCNGERLFQWQDGKLLKALKDGAWVLFDEINLASPELLD